MVQYANPHPSQPRSQFGNYGNQGGPQPMLQIGTVTTGTDGRPWVMTAQGWTPADPRMFAPHPGMPPQGMPGQGFPQPGPGYTTGPGQAVYPYPGQPPQGYPVYQPPGSQQLPVYSGVPQPTPQATVYQNPQGTRSQNRFGGGSQPQPQAAPHMPVYTPAPQQQPAQPTAQGEKDMQLISTGKTSMPKTILNSPSFKITTRTNIFNDVNAVVYPTLMITDCLDELLEQTIENTVNHERAPAALIATGVVEMIYHKASQSKYVGDLFQADVKSVYKAFKTHLAAVNNRYDLVYLSAINDFLTETANDVLYPILGTYPMIDSFTDDFNELLRSLRNNCSAEVEDLFVEQINDVLKKTAANFSLSEELSKVDTEESAPKEAPQRALIPAPMQIICLNYISTELGTQDNLANMLGGLADMIDGHVAYVCTIDKTVYKAFFDGDKVVLDLIRN